MPRNPNSPPSIPEGFAPVRWSQLMEGQRVWLPGTHEGVPITYGPHTVHSVENRRLRNARGEVFMHYPDNLLVQG